ncbi:MAG: M48 family metallopeptidase [Proteobacteria bacterium]|nr:M48 family metallopeptidase [Pseudomonadota bacterium]
MSYENPQVPHEVNVARGSHVLEFMRLAAGLALLVGIAAAVLYFAGGQLARLIPFSSEQQWVGDRVIGVATERSSTQEVADDNAKVVAYLQGSTDKLAAQMDLPAGMTVQAHLGTMGVPNAFATLGGHIVITRELYAMMPSENALAMVIAHEIAHVKHRDPISALGGMASIAALLALVSGDANSLAPQIALVVQRGYSREAERRADSDAVAALNACFGHAGGAAAVFEQLAAAHADERFQAPTLLATHPTDDERITRLQAAAGDWDAASEPLRPLAVPIQTNEPSIQERHDTG